MNSTSIIIGLGFILLFVTPLIYISNAGNRRKKRLLAKISAFAAEKSCKISEYDQWKNSCIGIDNENKKLFCVTKNEKLEIDLNNVSKYRLVGGINSDGSLKKQESTKIELQFTLKNPSNQALNIEFFDTSKDKYIVDEDRQLPEKWLNIVNSKINSKS